MKRKIVDYTTAIGSLLQGVDIRVCELIAEGFQPFGDPYLMDHEENVCQAMVKYADESED